MYKVHAAFDNTEQTIHKTSIQQTPNILHTLASLILSNKNILKSTLYKPSDVLEPFLW